MNPVRPSDKPDVVLPSGGAEGDEAGQGVVEEDDAEEEAIRCKV